MHEKFLGMPSIPEIRSLRGHDKARDWIQLMDFPGYAKALRGVGANTLAQWVEDGDLITAEAIDERSAAIEAGQLITTGFVSRDDVAGACPNIPAYIMGNPYNMRSKRRDKTGRGPLALFIEMTGSSGLDDDEMIERGAALFAMVKLLALARPLELWMTTTYGGVQDVMTQTAVRIETNPLDIARAAVLLTQYHKIAKAGSALNASMGASSETGHSAYKGAYGWAYGVPDLERTWAGEILGRVISPGSQIAYLPAGLLGTDDFTDSQAWIRKMLETYSPYLLEGADREDMES